MIHKVMFYISMCVIALAMWSMIYFYRMMAYDWNPPIVFEQNDNIKVVEWSYDGSSIETLSNGCVYTDVPSTVYYSVVWEKKYNMPSIDFVGWKNYKWKCFKDSINIRPLPPLPEWRYTLEFSTRFKVNALATRYVYGATQKFYIKA